MALNVQEFFDKNNGQGLDFDGYYGDQCMDLAQFYNRDVVGAPRLSGNAVDIWTTYPQGSYDRISNTPNGIPQLGDIMIWGTSIGQYGHIAVFKSGDQNQFISFDQNWPANSVCHFQQHNYSGILGWLRPKSETPEPMPTSPEKPPETAPIADDTRIHVGVNPETSHDYGDPMVSEVRNIIFGYEHQVNDLTSQLKSSQLVSDGNLEALNKSRADNEKLTAQLTETQNLVTDLQNKLTQASGSNQISPSGQTTPTQSANSPSNSFSLWDLLGQILGNVKKPQAS